MPAIVLTDCVRVAIEWRLLNGEPAVNVVHVGYDYGGPSGGTALGAAIEVRTAAQQHLLDAMVVGVSFVQVSYVDLGSASGETGIVGVSGSWPVVGQISGDSAGAQVAVIAELGPGDRQHRKGRMYLPGLAESHLQADGTNLTSGALDIWQTALDGFSDGVNSTDYQLGWVSDLAAESPDFRPADTHTIRQRVGTQRRRLLRG